MAEDPDIGDAFEKFFRAEFLPAVTVLLPLGTARSRTYLALRALRAALERRHR